MIHYKWTPYKLQIAIIYLDAGHNWFCSSKTFCQFTIYSVYCLYIIGNSSNAHSDLNCIGDVSTLLQFIPLLGLNK